MTAFSKEGFKRASSQTTASTDVSAVRFYPSRHLTRAGEGAVGKFGDSCELLGPSRGLLPAPRDCFNDAINMYISAADQAITRSDHLMPCGYNPSFTPLNHALRPTGSRHST